MVWLFLLIFVFIQSPSLIDAQSPQLNTSIWMEQLLPQIGNLHLYDITLPGTHDAASFVITSALSPDPAVNVINPANIPVVYTYTIFLLDLISLSVITVLYYLNRKIYKITAYRITLQKRCQIAENVKILTALFPLILVYTIIVPMGSVIKLLLIAFQLPSFPFSIQQIFLNLPHLIIFIHLIFVDLKRRKNVGDAKNEIVIQNVLGKNLSNAVTSEAYFKELKQMWN